MQICCVFLVSKVFELHSNIFSQQKEDHDDLPTENPTADEGEFGNQLEQRVS